MAERDPFGRLPDENPLAGLGVPSDSTDFEAAEPVVRSVEPEAKVRDDRAPRAARSEQAERLVAALERRRGARAGAGPEHPARSAKRPGKVVVAVVVLVAVGAFASTLFSAGTAVKDRIAELPSPSQALDDVNDSLDAAREQATAGGGKTGSGPVPRGLGSQSLLVRRNLAPALRQLATSGLGRLKSMSIRPERIDAQLLTKGGRLRSVQLRYDGELRRLSLSGPGFGALDTVPFARLDPAAPARMARSAAGRLKRPVSQVDYVVPLTSGPQVAWSVFMRDGKAFLGDARGRSVRPIG